MGRGSAKRAKLIQDMELLYIDRAYSDVEMAERIGVNRTTVYRIRQQMANEMGMVFILEPPARYRLDRKKQMSNVRLSQIEALALYLGGRRLQQQTRVAHEPTANALRKLANVMRQPMADGLVQAAEEVRQQEPDPMLDHNLEQIVEGWINLRKVRIRYRRARANTERVHLFSPYQFEPSIWGEGIYLIGHSDHYDTVISLKLGRVVRATVTMEPFTIPEDFDSHAMLAHAWGVWRADREPYEVRLRFTPQVTARVKESIWHPSQTIRDLPDGGCEWHAQIAEWREMEPWVRGWGSNVEVLQPEGLRESVAREMRAAALLYREG